MGAMEGKSSGQHDFLVVSGGGTNRVDSLDLTTGAWKVRC